MVIHVAEDKITIEASDPVIIEAGRAAFNAIVNEARLPGAIRGDQPACASLTTVWQALYDSLGVIQRRATLPAESPGGSRPAGVVIRDGSTAGRRPASRPPSPRSSCGPASTW
jgi:hypothetical protein